MSSTSSGGDSQVVLLRFGIVADDGNAAELTKIVKAGKKAQDDLNKGQRLEKVNTEAAEKSMLAYWAKIAKEMDRALADREKKQMQWGAKLAAQIDKDAREQTKAVENELKKQQGLYEAHSRVVGNAMGNLGGSAEKLARGLVLLGVAQEKDLGNAARMLATFEGTVAGLKGVYNAVTTVTTAYKSLTAAQAAAAAASALSSGAAAGGAAAGVAGAAGGAAAGGAAAGGGGLAASVVGAFTPAVIGLGAAAGALIGAAGAIVMATNVGGARDKVAGALVKTGWAGDETTALGDFLIGNDKSGKQARAATKKTARMERGFAQSVDIDTASAADQAAINRMQQTMLDSKIEQNRFGASAVTGVGASSAAGVANEDSRKATELAILDARRQIRETAAAGSREQAAANENLVALLEKQKALEVERLTINKQISQEAIDAAKTTRDSLVAQYNAATALAEKYKEQSLSAEERFGQMDPVQQKRIIEAKKKYDKGGELTREERQAIRSVGLDSTTDIARAGDIAASRKTEFGDLFLKPERQNEAGARAIAADTQVAINTQNEIIVKLEANSQTLAAEITTVVKNIVREQIALFKAEMQKQTSTERFEQAERNFSRQAVAVN